MSATIKLLRLPHPTDDQKVEQVKSQMQRLGPPTIRVVDCGEYHLAIEGCHRVTAAAELGVKPEYVLFALDDLIEVDGSLEGDRFHLGETYPGRAFVAEYRSCFNPKFTVNLDGTLAIVPKISREEE